LPVALTILAAHRSHIDLEATLLADPNWRCVFFDPVAGVFLPRRKAEQAGIAEVDFGARHFQPRRAVPELITGDLDGPAKPLAPQPPAAEAAALLKIAEVLATRPGHDAQARSIVLVAMDRAREAAWSQPQSIAGWRALGLASWSLARLSSAAGSQPGPAGDWAPSEMLDLARARYFLGRAHELDRSDFAVLLALFHTAVAQNDRDAQIEFGKRLRLRGARDARERPQLQLVRERLADLQAPDSAAELPPPVASSLQELTVRTDRRLADGQIAHAVAEFAGFVRVHGPLPWMLADRYAGLLMRQGDPSAARDVWQHQVLGDCDEGQRLERIASTYLVEGDSEAAIASYRTALRLSPTCGDARWGLARVYLECGDAAAVAEQYHDALDNPAISPAVRNQLQWMRELAEPYAVPKLEDPASREGD
jgi:tetratricopeptide (TPR) repeat protein